MADERSSTCTLPDEQDIYVIYGDVISLFTYVPTLYNILVLENECFLLADGVLSECQPPRWNHAFYGMFSSELISMGYAHYFSLVLCGRLLANLDSRVLVVITHSDVRDNNIMDNSTI